MFLLQNIFRFALILCGVFGLAFMIASTLLVIASILHGNISINIVKGKMDKEK